MDGYYSNWKPAKTVPLRKIHIRGFYMTKTTPPIKKRMWQGRRSIGPGLYWTKYQKVILPTRPKWDRGMPFLVHLLHDRTP